MANGFSLYQQGSVAEAEGQPEESKAFELAFGFIPTLNVGSALGVKQPFVRLAMDVLLDPFGYVIQPLALTKAGRAAKSASRAYRYYAKTTKGFDGIADTAKFAKGLSIEDRLKETKRILDLTEKANANPTIMGQLHEAVQKKDSAMALASLNKLRKAPSTGSLYKRYEERGLLKDLERVIRLEGEGIQIQELGATLGEKAMRGQISLLRLGLPFSEAEKVILDGTKTLPHLSNAMKWFKGGIAKAAEHVKPGSAAKAVHEAAKNAPETIADVAEEASRRSADITDVVVNTAKRVMPDADPRDPVVTGISELAEKATVSQAEIEKVVDDGFKGLPNLAQIRFNFTNSAQRQKRLENSVSTIKKYPPIPRAETPPGKRELEISAERAKPKITSTKSDVGFTPKDAYVTSEPGLGGPSAKPVMSRKKIDMFLADRDVMYRNPDFSDNELTLAWRDLMDDTKAGNALSFEELRLVTNEIQRRVASGKSNLDEMVQFLEVPSTTIDVQRGNDTTVSIATGLSERFRYLFEKSSGLKEGAIFNAIKFEAAGGIKSMLARNDRMERKAQYLTVELAKEFKTEFSERVGKTKLSKAQRKMVAGDIRKENKVVADMMRELRMIRSELARSDTEFAKAHGKRILDEEAILKERALGYPKSLGAAAAGPTGWSRYSKAGTGYEVSSQGDKRFSALYAKLKDGRTIEEAYQLDVKGYRKFGNDWRLGKGKPPLERKDTWAEYLGLWRQWASENPDLIEDLRQKSSGKVLTDKFASTQVSQARALSTILSE